MKECKAAKVYEGAKFEYSIRVFGIRMRWMSRILDYNLPERFTDIQLIGPYRRWEHQYIFENNGKKTLIRDIVTYSPPVYAIPFHSIIKRQLTDIFSYRSVRIKEWASGNFSRKAASN